MSKPAKPSSPSSRKVVSKKIKSRIKPKIFEEKSELERMFEKIKNRKLQKADMKGETKVAEDDAKVENKTRVQEIKSKFESLKSSEALKSSESCQSPKSQGWMVREEGRERMHRSFIHSNPDKTVRLRDVHTNQKDYEASPGKRKLEIDAYTVFLGTNCTPKKRRGF